MAEYIERQKVFDSLPTVVEDKTITLYGAVADFMVLVSAIPAADVAPVVHGRWKYFRKQGIAVCMNCSFERNLDDNFGRAISCPNCGARMDGE